jgi:hypothetical protein
MRHRKPSTCDRSMRAAGSIGYLAHPDLQPLPSSANSFLHVQTGRLWLVACVLRNQEASPAGSGCGGRWGLTQGTWRSFLARQRKNVPTYIHRPPAPLSWASVCKPGNHQPVTSSLQFPRSWLAPLASAGPALSATCSAWEGRVLYWAAACTEVHPAPVSVTTGGSSLSQLPPQKI